MDRPRRTPPGRRLRLGQTIDVDTRRAERSGTDRARRKRRVYHDKKCKAKASQFGRETDAARAPMGERKEVKRAVEATDGRFLFGALIDVYDHSNNEKQ